MRSSGKTWLADERSLVARTKSKIACLAAPSFHDGSRPPDVAVGGRGRGKERRGQGWKRRQRREQNAAVDTGGRYHELFDQEVRYIKASQPYAQSRYQQEREKILDSALRELERLRAQLQANLNSKLETMEQAARSARNIAIAGTLVLIGLGVVLSLLISRSITKPLSELTRRTAEEPEDSSSAVEAGGIPEIQELSEILAHERHRIREAARSQADFFDDLSEQITVPLTSIQQRLTYLQRHLSQGNGDEQNPSLEVIIKETERLIDHCNQLKPPPAAVLAAAGDCHEPVRYQSRKAS